MHACAPTLPLLASKNALIGPNQGLSRQDSFKTVLQGRLVAHLRRGIAGKKEKAPKELSKLESQTPAKFRRMGVVSRQRGVAS